jgi:hypothetical protein
MGSSKSTTPAPSSAASTVKTPQRSFQDFAVTAGQPTGYKFGPDGETSGSSPSQYLAESQRPSTEGFRRPTSMVSEMRKAGSQLFGQALGVDDAASEEGANKIPGVSTSRMAGDVLKGFTDKLAGEIDPTKGMTDETENLRYGIGGAAKKPEGAYTTSAAAPLM